jgi:hypothetical protein
MDTHGKHSNSHKQAEWHPQWWSKSVHGHAFERVRAAMERDWNQTRHELGLGGHELNQDIGDTTRQAVGKERIPTPEQANPPRVIGAWSEAEVPYGYGYAAVLTSNSQIWQILFKQTLLSGSIGSHACSFSIGSNTVTIALSSGLPLFTTSKDGPVSGVVVVSLLAAIVFISEVLLLAISPLLSKRG